MYLSYQCRITEISTVSNTHRICTCVLFVYFFSFMYIFLLRWASCPLIRYSRCLSRLLICLILHTIFISTWFNKFNLMLIYRASFTEVWESSYIPGTYEYVENVHLALTCCQQVLFHYFQFLFIILTHKCWTLIVILHTLYVFIVKLSGFILYCEASVLS